MIYLVFILFAGFASTFTISKTALEYTEPLFLLGSRMVAAGLVLLLYLFFFEREKLKITKGMWLGIFLVGLLNIFMANAFELWGLQDLSSAKTCFIYSLSPFMAAIISYYFFSEAMTLKKWLGMVIAFLGFIPAFLGHTEGETLIAGQSLFSWAELYVAVAALSTVLGWILLQRVVARHNCSFLLVNSLAMLIGGIMALGLSYGVESWQPLPLPHTHIAKFAAAVLMLLLISNIICYNLYGFLLKTYTSTFMSCAGLMTPLFATLFGWVFLGEYHPAGFLFSIAVVSLGMAIFYVEEIKRGHLIKSMSGSSTN